MRIGKLNKLSRREREIMDIVFRLGKATAVDISEMLPDAPGNSTIRKQLVRLEEKKILTHEKNGKQFLYSPTVSIDYARGNALDQLVLTFFHGSASSAVVGLLDRSKSKITEKEREILLELIESLDKEETHD